MLKQTKKVRTGVEDKRTARHAKTIATVTLKNGMAGNTGFRRTKSASVTPETIFGRIGGRSVDRTVDRTARAMIVSVTMTAISDASRGSASCRTTTSTKSRISESATPTA